MIIGKINFLELRGVTHPFQQQTPIHTYVIVTKTNKEDTMFVHLSTDYLNLSKLNGFSTTETLRRAMDRRQLLEPHDDDDWTSETADLIEPENPEQELDAYPDP